MARLYAASTGAEPLPDLVPLRASNALDDELVGLLDPADLVPRWDRIEGEASQDFDVIGVDGKGIYVRLHPDIILDTMPRAAEVIELWLEGDREITREDVHELDAYALSLKRVMDRASKRRPL